MPAPMVPGALGELNADLTGQTLQQAWESQNMSDPYDVGFGIANWTGNKPAISGNTNSTIHDSSETDPVDAWHDYVDNEAGEVSDITGGIVDGSNVNTFVYSLVEKHPQVGVDVVEGVVPVAVPLEQAYVAIGQVLGLSMDAAEMEVETKQKLANSITQFNDLVYDAASGLVKAWWDGVNILFPKKAVEAVSDLIEVEGWSGVTGGTATYNDKTVTFVSELEAIPSDTQKYKNIQSTYICRTSANQATGYGYSDPVAIRNLKNGTQNSLNHNYQFTFDGVTIYGYGPIPGSLFDISLPQDYYSTSVTAEILVKGTIHPSGNYPEGTGQSQATSYNPTTIPIYGELAVNDTDTIELVPVNLPENPTDTIDSTTDPISSTDEETVENLPSPPIPLPIPDTRPSNPEIPLTNPTIIDQELIDTLVEELANTLDPQPGQSSGIIPVPDLPGIGDPPTFPSIIPASGPGFIHVYNPTPAEFVAFGSWLWVTYADATIDKILNNPFDGVIGAHELYATPNTGGTDNIRSAFLTCPTTAALVPNRYSEIDCGTVIIPEFYGNYLDYSPYSQAYIYLPFIGINEVSIDDIVGHAVNIRYRVDSYSGSCIAMIFVAKNGYQNLCYQFAGSCSVEVPMAGGSQAAIKAGEMQAEAYARAGIANAALNGAAAIGSGLATGGLAGGLLGGLSALGGVAGAWYSGQRSIDAARIANKSSVQHSGQFGASHGAMGKKEPFIIIRNPIQVKVTNYNEDYGYPAHKRVIIGGCTGYLRVKEVNVISANATDEEKMAIEALLKNGVYVS